MNPIPEAIKTFLLENSISTVCFVDHHTKPYCINCFYLYEPNQNLLIFKSSPGTTHHEFTNAQASVSGTILPKSIDVVKLKGLQFWGNVLEDELLSRFSLSTAYLKKYPMSFAIPGYVWAVQIISAKLTDNTLGFGNKTTWQSV
ncbi:MAG: hypothetical protein K0R26_1569 [Bacteroidota bacterium]|jgi:uncharacterized protein YhbP (UPF0306 family)|nr:hypothetical protein [Bacteroidota bacterium]